MIVCYLDETILKLVSHLCPLNGLQWVPRSLGSTVDEESGLRISHSSPFLTARQRHIWRCTHLRSTTYNNWQDINTLISSCLFDTDTTTTKMSLLQPLIKQPHSWSFLPTATLKNSLENALYVMIKVNSQLHMIMRRTKCSCAFIHTFGIRRVYVFLWSEPKSLLRSDSWCSLWRALLNIWNIWITFKMLCPRREYLTCM